MPRKIKQKQRQKQKQSQTVIVNVGRSRGKGSKQERRPPPPPPSPQFVPYPVPALRGPDQMVTPQPTLIQMLEALRSIKAPVVARVPAPAVPAPISQIIADGKEEAGPEQIVGADDPLIGGDQPLVDTKPRRHTRRPKLAPVAAEAASSSSSTAADALPFAEDQNEGEYHTYESLDAFTVPRLQVMAGDANIKGRTNMVKSSLILALLRRGLQR